MLGLDPERNRTKGGPRACRLRSLKSSQTHFASESGQIKSIRVGMDSEKGHEATRMAYTDIEDKGLKQSARMIRSATQAPIVQLSPFVEEIPDARKVREEYGHIYRI